MQGIKFEKVSFGTFLKFFQSKDYLMYYVNDMINHKLIDGTDDIHSEALLIKYLYDNYVKLPERKTACSVGYDIYTPLPNFNIEANGSYLLPTGIKAKMPENVGLFLYPRSSAAIKYNLSLKNVVGIVESDYYNNPDNEGHILTCITNNSTPKSIHSLNPDKITIFNGIYVIDNNNCNIIQGIFKKFEVTEDDNASAVRKGGIGSTNN